MDNISDRLVELNTGQFILVYFRPGYARLYHIMSG
jgi:hypothetical protein